MSGYCWTEGIIITILQICPKNHSPWASFFLPRRIDAMATGRQQLATGQLDSWVTEKSTPMEMAAIQGKAKALTALEQFTEVKISLICILYFVFLYTFFCIIVFCSMLSCCRYLHFTLPHSPPPRVGWATLPSHSLPIPCKWKSMASQVTPQVMLYKMYKLMRDEQGGLEPSQEFQDILQKLPKDMVSLSKYISLLRSNVP